MSFDRPQYLEMVLQTICRQKDIGNAAFRFFLFQDAVVSRNTQSPLGDSKGATEAVQVFRRYIPDGVVVTSEWNLGVARNFDRAERAFFEDLKAPFAWFFEDDMLLVPHYFKAMLELSNVAMRRPDIGMFSAYGFHHATPMAVQKKRQREICLMNEHNWAFGISRECWLARDQIVREYLDLIDGIDYRERGKFSNEIKAFQLRVGRGGRGYLSSQDSIKNMACERLGFHRITTFANFARYVGRQGEHMNAEKFAKRGYDATVVLANAPDSFDFPSPDELQRMRIVMHGTATRLAAL